MITIIEGPDATGKTTLARTAFAECRYAHQGRYVDNVFVETIAKVRSVQQPAVIDRLHLGELVYGPVMRGGSMMTTVQQRQIERVLYGLRAVVVVALPPYEVALSTWQRTLTERDEYVKDKDRYRETYEGFMHLRSSLPLVLYDHTRHTVEQLLEQLQKERPPFNSGPGAGHFREGNTLLIGEQPNMGQRGWWEYPFVNCASGDYLTAELERLNVSERELYWVNALDPAGRWTHPGNWLDELRPSRVVALGKKAEQWCNFYWRKRFHAVPHPQHQKRFHHHAHYTALQEALCF